MRWTTLSAVAALLSSAHEAVGGSLQKSSSRNLGRAARGEGYLSLPVGTAKKPQTKAGTDDGSKKPHSKRDALLQKLDNRNYFYTADIEIGKPPQKVTVLLDTGSNELWVNPDCANAATAAESKKCRSFGRYDPHDSRTPPVGPFGAERINYGDASDPSTQTSAVVQFYADTLTLGDHTVRNQTFGVVARSEGIAQGILGLAPDLHAGFRARDKPYSLLLTTMADQGLIARRAFSLDLRHQSQRSGAVVFGGVDRNRFVGRLTGRPMVRGQSGEFRLAAALSSVGVDLGDGSGMQRLSIDGGDGSGDDLVMLDSGTTISRLHSTVALPLLDALGAVDSGEGYYLTNCGNRGVTGGLEFAFGDAKVRVPYSDFILDLSDGSGDGGGGGGGPSYCYLGIVLTEGQQILGESVLRAGYFVFDWDSERVFIAEAATCGDGDDIVAVDSDGAIEKVKGNCKPSDARDTGALTTAAVATRTVKHEAPAYTTTYTITSCPVFELSCQTGVVTTQTVGGHVRPTVTVTGTAKSGNKSDSAAGPAVPLGWVAVVFGAFVVGLNLV